MSDDTLTPQQIWRERLIDEYEERAAILQYEANYPRDRAEMIARAQVIKWGKAVRAASSETEGNPGGKQGP